jgi:hypothetical protein
MRHGVVFMSCHNAILEQAALLLKSGVNPDGLSHAQLAAELTNHLLDAVVLIPGATGTGTMPELQQVAFTTQRESGRVRWIGPGVDSSQECG